MRSTGRGGRAQFKGFEADLRNGSVLGQLNGVTPSPTTVNTTASRFLGTRYVYNVVRKAAHPASYTNQLARRDEADRRALSLGGSLSRRRVHLRRRSDQGDHQRRFRPAHLGCDGRRPPELRLPVESGCAITNRSDGLESRSGGGPGSAPGPPRARSRSRLPLLVLAGCTSSATTRAEPVASSTAPAASPSSTVDPDAQPNPLPFNVGEVVALPGGWRVQVVAYGATTRHRVSRHLRPGSSTSPSMSG